MCDQNGWQIMLSEIGHLCSQLESGAGYVSQECLRKVTNIAQLVSSVLQSDPGLWSSLSQIIMSLVTTAER